MLIQSNLDYSKCQGPQESFRIIGSSNDRNRVFSVKLGCFHRLQLVFSVKIKSSVKALQKMSSLEVVASSSLMLCRSKNAEKKRKSELLIHLYIDTCIHYIHVPTSITTMKMKVKCKLTNHMY